MRPIGNRKKIQECRSQLCRSRFSNGNFYHIDMYKNKGIVCVAFAFADLIFADLEVMPSALWFFMQVLNEQCFKPNN